jgi:hypothetical protein
MLVILSLLAPGFVACAAMPVLLTFAFAGALILLALNGLFLVLVFGSVPLWPIVLGVGTLVFCFGPQQLTSWRRSVPLPLIKKMVLPSRTPRGGSCPAAAP